MEKEERIGKYIVEKELAHSTICTVYRAKEESLHRPVLIKRLHPQIASETDIRDRFEREAQVCALVNHDNIVAIYGYHAEPELSMLILEYIEGISLGDLIAKTGSIPWEVTLTMMVGVLSGLSFAHQKGVIHRDLKPDNILISNEGQVKITDFGLATLEDAPKLTRQGMVLGTPSYMPPETLTGAGSDFKSDLFSLGVTFYESLTGISPFHGENFSEIMNNILKVKPKKLTELNPDIPVELNNIILRLMEKKPAARYANASLALDDLKELAAATQITPGKKIVRDFLDTSEVSNLDSAAISSLPRTPSSLPDTSAMNAAPTTPADAGWSFDRAFKRFGIPAALIMALLIWRFFIWLPDSPIQSETAPDSAVTAEIAELVPDKDSVQVEDKIDTPPEVEKEAESVQNTVKNQANPQRSTEKVTDSDAAPTPEDQTEAADEDIVNSGLKSPPGRLRVTFKQWAHIFVDDTYAGQTTPTTKTISLSAGKHNLKLLNDSFPDTVSVDLEIRGGEDRAIEIDLLDYFAQIKLMSITPWAYVWVNGKNYGSTPRSKPILLPFGTHEIELRNPQFDTWSRKVVLSAENPRVDISAKLTAKDSAKADER